MIKTHNKTKLKYLCYSRKPKSDLNDYSGSGTLWLNHLKQNGHDITTEIIFETENYGHFVEYSRKVSLELNIVESEEWANLKLEEGDGGDTVSNKMWITDGIVDKYILKIDNIPDGWKRGRSNCVFNEVKKQKEYSKRSDRKKAGASIREAWERGDFDKRDNSKVGFKTSEDNVMKRPEVLEKLRSYAKNRPPGVNKLIGVNSGLSRTGKKRGPYKKRNTDG
jgi:hypothetical protein